MLHVGTLSPARSACVKLGPTYIDRAVSAYEPAIKDDRVLALEAFGALLALLHGDGYP